MSQGTMGGVEIMADPVAITAGSETIFTFDSVVDVPPTFNIYRNDVLVGTSETPTFTDNDIPEGTHTYTISAVDTYGNESAKSSSSYTLLIDLTPPPAPTNLQVTYVDDLVTLTWT